MLLDLVENTKQTYVLLVLVECVYATTSFELRMSKGPMMSLIGFEFFGRRLDTKTHYNWLN